MARNVIAVLGLLAALSFGGTSIAQIAPDSSRLGYLTLETRPSQLLVAIDGKWVGKTPLNAYPLQAGQHRLLVRRSPEYSWYLHDWVATINIEADDTLRLNKVFPRPYLLQTTPYGARVFLGDSLLGETPLSLELADTARVELLLQRQGYHPTVVVLGPQSEQRVHVVLEPEPSFLANQVRGINTALARKHRYRKIALLSGGISLGAGLAAILLKKKADHLYGQYQRTALPSEMDHLFEETQRYDRYSGAMFGLFQIGFAVGFYYFLRSNHP